MYLLDILQASYIYELLERFNETKTNDGNFFAKTFEKLFQIKVGLFLQYFTCKVDMVALFLR